MSGMSRVEKAAVDREAVCQEVVSGRFYLADDNCEVWAGRCEPLAVQLASSCGWWTRSGKAARS